MDAQAHAALQDAFLRIVTPMRREFGIAVDVPRLRSDRAYAAWLVALGRTGQAPVLQRAAAHIGIYLDAADLRDAGLQRVRTSASAALSLPA